jgi:predicted nuclease with TOPRIM domain
MLDKLFSLFPTYQNRIEKLEKENAELKEKLAKRQEDINKTNAYWKKKLAGFTNPRSSSK